MSSYQSRCGEIRRRVLQGESQASVARDETMPGAATVGRHLRGECLCSARIPPVESVGHGPNLSYRVTEPVECPHCGHTDAVEALDQFTEEWRCRDCAQEFGLFDALERAQKVLPDGGTRRAFPGDVHSGLTHAGVGDQSDGDCPHTDDPLPCWECLLADDQDDQDDDDAPDVRTDGSGRRDPFELIDDLENSWTSDDDCPHCGDRHRIQHLRPPRAETMIYCPRTGVVE